MVFSFLDDNSLILNKASSLSNCYYVNRIHSFTHSKHGSYFINFGTQASLTMSHSLFIRLFRAEKLKSFFMQDSSKVFEVIFNSALSSFYFRKNIFSQRKGLLVVLLALCCFSAMFTVVTPTEELKIHPISYQFSSTLTL